MLMCEATSTAAVLGVRAVWVHHTMRRQGVATRLLDTMRYGPGQSMWDDDISLFTRSYRMGSRDTENICFKWSV